MSYTIIFGIIAMSAFALQMAAGYLQLKNFNQVYRALRRKGRVAIGKRPGKIRVGTIVLFALDAKSKIIDARMLQGVTVFSRFKEIKNYIGQDIHFIDRKHPLVQQENKFTQLAMENARDIYLQIELGTDIIPKPKGLLDSIGDTLKVNFRKLKNS